MAGVPSHGEPTSWSLQALSSATHRTFRFQQKSPSHAAGLLLFAAKCHPGAGGLLPGRVIDRARARAQVRGWVRCG